MRRHGRNYPVTGKIGSRKLEFSAFVSAAKGTRRQKLAAWKKAKKFHGQTEDRIIMAHKRRKKSHNRKSMSHRRTHRKNRWTKKGWKSAGPKKRASVLRKLRAGWRKWYKRTHGKRAKR